MNTFIQGIQEQEARTLNQMKARKTTASKGVDLFYKIGASRGQDIIPNFVGAFVENQDIATRIALWARDVRGGAGERKLFRDILLHLDKTGQTDLLKRVLARVPELGRWDDLLLDFSSEVEKFAFGLIKEALDAGNGLCAKWMPRKGMKAIKLRSFLGLTPKQYRKTLVSLSNTVEQQMCGNEWDEINYSHVPSVASSRYRNAFNRHSPEKYKEYVNALTSDDPEVRKTVKANAGAVYPYDVIKQLDISESYYASKVNSSQFFGASVLKHIIGQWEALPNYMNDSKVLPLVDVSGSMWSSVGLSGLKAIDVSVSLGLYCADKNKGVFKDTFLTFTTTPHLVTLKGNIVDKAFQLSSADWGGSTNLHSAFSKILQVALDNSVPEDDMPETLLIISDMQFNYCINHDDSAIQMIERKYSQAGYQVPKVVFWNICSYDNVPVRFDKTGTALVSGFSPSIMEAVLADDLEQFTPESVMLKKIMSDRYNY